MTIRNRRMWFGSLVVALLMGLSAIASAQDQCTARCNAQSPPQACCVQTCQYYTCANEIRRANPGLDSDLLRQKAELDCESRGKLLTNLSTCQGAQRDAAAKERSAAFENFQGDWLFRGIAGQDCSIEHVIVDLVVTTEKGVRAIAQPVNATTIVVDFPFAKGLRGTLTPDKKRINWSNGEHWSRK